MGRVKARDTLTNCTTEKLLQPARGWASGRTASWEGFGLESMPLLARSSSFPKHLKLVLYRCPFCSIYPCFISEEGVVFLKRKSPFSCELDS